MEQKSLKNQAQEIMVAVDQDLQQVDSKALAIRNEVDARANAILKTIFNVVSDVDLEAAKARVQALKEAHPEASLTELSQKLVSDKCQRTGAVGAVTSGAGLIPGIGTAAAVTLGVAADIGATFKLQAELVLEIAALYDYPMTQDEKQRVVMFITGLSAGTNALARKAGQTIAVKASERFAGKAFLKAVPVVGVVAAAGTNVLSTYIIGQRADAYFRLGPEAVGSWSDSLRAISGVDERKIAGWLSDGGKATGAAIVSGANRVGQAGKAAGEAVASGAGKVAETVGPALSSGARRAGASAQKGVRAYLRWVYSFWSGVFRLIGRGLSIVWAAVTYLPRQVGGLLRRKSGPNADRQE